MAQRDMFLKIDGIKQGPIKGEANDLKHRDEIDVISWSWGMNNPGDAFTQVNSRTSFDQLRIVKLINRSTPALMSALRHNEMIKQAVLSVRKAGGANPLDYFLITIEKARVTNHQVSGGEGSDSSILSEEICFSFQKVRVEYVLQGKIGGGSGTSTFETAINPNT